MTEITNTIKAPKEHFGTEDVISEAKEDQKRRVEDTVARLDEALNFGPKPEGWDEEHPDTSWPGLSRTELQDEFEAGIYSYTFRHDPTGDPGDLIAVYCVAELDESGQPRVPAARTKKLKRHEVRTWHPHHGTINEDV